MNDMNSLRESEFRTLRDYIVLFKQNLIIILIITVAIFGAAVVYAMNTIDIYKSATTLKITPPKGTILDVAANPFNQIKGIDNDRFIKNEIETMMNITIREQVAKAVLDSFATSPHTDRFFLVLNRDSLEKITPKSKDDYPLRSYRSLANTLKRVEVGQKSGLDFIEITASSPSPYEAALIANEYAKTYRKFNLMDNRKQLTMIKDFLKQQKDEKQSELALAENRKSQYTIDRGLIELNSQAQNIVTTLANFEAQKNTAEIEMSISKQSLANFKSELSKINPTLSKYLESQAALPFITKIQEAIAEKKLARINALMDPRSNFSENSQHIINYDNEIADLESQLNERTTKFSNDILASTPAEIKTLTQVIFEEEVKYNKLVASFNGLSEMVRVYERKLNRLPKNTLELARLERERVASEQLYIMLEQKYQEAYMNEQSTPGNVLIMNAALAPVKPSAPNRQLIIIFGLMFGFGVGFGFVLVRSYFDRTIKTPKDIENKKLNLLAWLPKIEEFTKKGADQTLIVSQSPDSIPAEAFKALRTRVQFSKYIEEIKSMLVTSSAPQEGKTTVSVNLSVSFAQANQRTVILDCDLRIPRVHTFFNEKKAPGFTDFIIGRTTYENIVRKTDIKNLYYISAGTIPPNPSEIISSPQMKSFIKKLESEFDVVIVDSPPVMAVTDSEILSRFVDTSVLVVCADSTESEWVDESVELLTNEKKNFLGVVLNKFNHKSGYHSYYKYYQYYSKPGKKKKTRG